MTKQHLAVTHGNHVIMKNALVDNVRVLLGENHLLGIHLIQPCHRLAGFASLSRRITGRPGIIAFFSPVDKKLHTRFTVMTAETIVVCRPLITQQRYLWQRRMDAKFLFVVKNRF